MSRKKFDTFPVQFHWKDAMGCFSLLFGLFLATATLNGKSNPHAKKQESVVSLAEKQLQSIVIPQTLNQEAGFVGPQLPLVGPPLPSELNQKVSEKKTPTGGFFNKVFNKKYSVN